MGISLDRVARARPSATVYSRRNIDDSAILIGALEELVFAALLANEGNRAFFRSLHFCIRRSKGEDGEEEERKSSGGELHIGGELVLEDN